MYILSGYNVQKAYCPADYKYAASGSNSCHNLLIEDSLIGIREARWNCLFLSSCLQLLLLLLLFSIRSLIALAAAAAAFSHSFSLSLYLLLVICE